MSDYFFADDFDKGHWFTASEMAAINVGIPTSNPPGVPYNPDISNNFNAFQHAFSSAVLAYRYGESVARGLGWTKEFFIWDEGSHQASDHNRDFWNNSVGISIGMAAAQQSGNLSEYDIAVLVKAALERGDLITNKDTDQRLAPEMSTFVDARTVIEECIAGTRVTWVRSGPSLFDLMNRATSHVKLAMEITNRDPLLLDLDGDGIETISVSNGRYFDYAGDGFAEATGWVGSDDGILVRDLNSDGHVNDGTELFGDFTVLQNNTVASGGFSALADLDSNSDGEIDYQDAEFASLKVLKGDGQLFTLAELGIESLSLTHSSSSMVDDAGNTQMRLGSYSTASNTRELADYSLARDLWNY